MKRWFKYIKPYWPLFILGPLCMIVEVIGEVLMPQFLANIINAANSGELTSPESLKNMVIMIVIALVMMAGGVGGAYFASKASVNFAADLRADLYAKVQKFSFANVDYFSTGSLVTRLTNDVTQIRNFIAMLMRMALRAPGMMIAGLVMAILINPPLSTVFAVSIPLLLLTIFLLVRIGFKRFTVMQDRIDGLNSTVQENITNVRVVKSFVREDVEIDKFNEANGNLKDSGMAAFRIMIFLQPVMTIFMNLTVLAVILIGGSIVLNNGMEVGSLSQFVTYVTQILMSLLMITFLIIMSSRALASGRRIAEVQDVQIDVTDDGCAQPEKTVDSGNIEFRDVSFRYYKSSEDLVLKKINLRIESGQTVGIIGSTGSGKTTLVSMIPRLYDVDEGQVLVDGVDVRDYALKNLREGVGMVLQKNTLFSGSVKDNLLWGNENATDEEIVTAARHAQADKFITTFEQGYDAPITKGGSNVSGGQKQRLCIARALLKQPKILILDDSTSAVDTATERQIWEAFRDELKDSTKIIIAQRISSVKDADVIIVVNEGTVTGVGTHDELLASNEEYKEIYESQTGKEG
ncbi:MAG: ABC transporter ATP-binding protein [Clostridia bacterium]|nr:ABC transporter ATP-binding protein [Clostridia bacterium]